MKVEWDKKTLLPRYVTEESDRVNLAQIKNMIEGHFACKSCGKENSTNGWKALTQWLESAKERIINEGMESYRSRVKKEMSPEHWAVLAGFVKAMETANEVLRQQQAKDDLLEQIKKRKEERDNEED